MKLLKSLLAVILFSLCLPVFGQAPTFDELEFEPDSIKAAYKPTGKNYVFVRSKRGTSGVNKVASADAILSSEVSEIILVFSEIEASSFSEREEANRERWENLLKTYPEFFQFSTTYKNICQCNNRGDSAAFKHAQGFYVYVNGEVPKVAAEPVAASTPAPKSEPVAEKAPASKPATTKPVQPAQPTEAMKAVKAEDKKVAANDVTLVKTKEPPVVEKQEKAAPKEVEAPAVAATPEETPEETVKEPVKKKSTGSTKPRKAKDPKACRPPCYGSGEDDLNTFFKDNISLTKKEKKKAKSWMANVRLQINFDGSVKKVIVTGSDEDANKKIEESIKAMNNWNAAVRGGLSVKSEVRFTMKFDKGTKAMRPSDFVINPRPSPKCQCQSDSEIFGD